MFGSRVRWVAGCAGWLGPTEGADTAGGAAELRAERGAHRVVEVLEREGPVVEVEAVGGHRAGVTDDPLTRLPVP